MGQTLTISPIRPDDLYEARYIAEITPSEDVHVSRSSDIEAFDLSEGERIHPWDTRIFFALETVAIGENHSYIFLQKGNNLCDTKEIMGFL